MRGRSSDHPHDLSGVLSANSHRDVPGLRSNQVPNRVTAARTTFLIAIGVIPIRLEPGQITHADSPARTAQTEVTAAARAEQLADLIVGARTDAEQYQAIVAVL